VKTGNRATGGPGEFHWQRAGECDRNASAFSDGIVNGYQFAASDAAIREQ
jgi:hypothetical protein